MIEFDIAESSSNIRIALFMGGVLIPAEKGKKSFIQFFDEDGKMVEQIRTDKLKYHISWEWIMPVYVKIKNYYDATYIPYKTNQGIKEPFKNVTKALCSGNIINLHVEVDEFTQWYKNWRPK